MGATQFGALESSKTPGIAGNSSGGGGEDNQQDGGGRPGSGDNERGSDGGPNTTAATSGGDGGGGSAVLPNMGTVRDEIEKLSRDPRKRELYRLLQEHMKDRGGDMLPASISATSGADGSTAQNGSGTSGGAPHPRFLDSRRIKTYKSRDDEEDEPEDDEGGEKMELGEIRREDLGKLLGVDMSGIELRNCSSSGGSKAAPRLTPAAATSAGPPDNDDEEKLPRPSSRDSSVTMTANSPCSSPHPSLGGGDILPAACPKKKFLDEFRSRSNSVGSQPGDEEAFRYRSNSLSAGLHSRMAHGNTAVATAAVLHADEQFRQRSSTVASSRPTLKKRLLAAATEEKTGTMFSDSPSPPVSSTPPRSIPALATTTTTKSSSTASPSKPPLMNVKTYIDKIFESEVMKMHLQQDSAADSPPATPLNPQRIQQQVSGVIKTEVDEAGNKSHIQKISEQVHMLPKVHPPGPHGGRPPQKDPKETARDPSKTQRQNRSDRHPHDLPPHAPVPPQEAARGGWRSPPSSAFHTPPPPPPPQPQAQDAPLDLSFKQPKQSPSPMGSQSSSQASHYGQFSPSPSKQMPKASSSPSAAAYHHTPAAADYPHHYSHDRYSAAAANYHSPAAAAAAATATSTAVSLSSAPYPRDYNSKDSSGGAGYFGTGAYSGFHPEYSSSGHYSNRHNHPHHQQQHQQQQQHQHQQQQHQQQQQQQQQQQPSPTSQSSPHRRHPSRGNHYNTAPYPHVSPSSHQYPPSSVHSPAAVSPHHPPPPHHHPHPQQQQHHPGAGSAVPHGLPPPAAVSHRGSSGGGRDSTSHHHLPRPNNEESYNLVQQRMVIEREILNRMNRSTSSSLSSSAPPPPRHSPRPPSHDARQAPPPQLLPPPQATPQQLYEQRQQQLANRAAGQGSGGGAMSITGGYKPATTTTTSTASAAPPASVPPPAAASGIRGNSALGILGDHPPEDVLFLKCNECTSTYGSVHNFRRHYAKVHGNCDHLTTQHVTIQSISQTKSERARQQRDHMEPSAAATATASRESSLDAKQAGREQRRYSTSSGSLSEDSNTGHGGGGAEHHYPSTMKCLQCGMEFSTRDFGVFKRHMRTHEGGTHTTSEDTSGALSCSACKLMFKEADEWRLHMSLEHSSHSCICRLCDTGFATSDALHKHMKTGVHTNSRAGNSSSSNSPDDNGGPTTMHSRAREVEYRCLQCALAFASEHDLYVHTRAQHRADKAVWATPPGADTPPHVRRATPDSTSYEDNKTGDAGNEKHGIKITNILELIEKKVIEEHRKSSHPVPLDPPKKRRHAMMDYSAMPPKKVMMASLDHQGKAFDQFVEKAVIKEFAKEQEMSGASSGSPTKKPVIAPPSLTSIPNMTQSIETASNASTSSSSSSKSSSHERGSVSGSGSRGAAAAAATATGPPVTAPSSDANLMNSNFLTMLFTYPLISRGSDKMRDVIGEIVRAEVIGTSAPSTATTTAKTNTSTASSATAATMPLLRSLPCMNVTQLEAKTKREQPEGDIMDSIKNTAGSRSNQGNHVCKILRSVMDSKDLAASQLNETLTNSRQSGDESDERSESNRDFKVSSPRCSSPRSVSSLRGESPKGGSPKVDSPRRDTESEQTQSPVKIEVKAEKSPESEEQTQIKMETESAEMLERGELQIDESSDKGNNDNAEKSTQSKSDTAKDSDQTDQSESSIQKTEQTNQSEAMSEDEEEGELRIDESRSDGELKICESEEEDMDTGKS